MNLLTHLKQVVTIRRRGEPNDYNQFDYEDPVEVPAMFEPDDGLKQSAMGQDVAVESNLMTVDRLQLGDLVSGQIELPDGSTYEVEDAEVRRVTPIIFKGRAIGFEARL